MRQRYFLSLLGLVAACSTAGEPLDDFGSSEGAQVGDKFNSGGVSLMVIPGGPTAADTNRSSVFAGASFEKNSEDSCMSVRSGACVLSTCALVEPELGTTVDAGRITITGGQKPIVLTPDPLTHSYPYTQTLDAVLPGQVLTIRAAGSSDVPPFVSRLTVPEPVTVTFPPEVAPPAPGQPPLTDEQKLHIPRNQDFEITWSGGTGHVLARLIHFTATATERYISCEFQAADGKGVIPSKFLRFFPQRPEVGFLFELTSEAHVGNDGHLKPSHQSSQRWHIGKSNRMMLQGTQEILFD